MQAHFCETFPVSQNFCFGVGCAAERAINAKGPWQAKHGRHGLFVFKRGATGKPAARRRRKSRQKCPLCFAPAGARLAARAARGQQGLHGRALLAARKARRAAHGTAQGVCALHKLWRVRMHTRIGV